MSKWLPAGLGAEPKKLAILGLLVALTPVAYYYGTSSDAPTTPVSNAPRPAVPAVQAPRSIPAARPKQTRGARGGTDDFRPTLNLPDDFDLTKVDPTLRTDLLDKVRQIGEAGGSRSLFEFYTPPPPPLAQVKIMPAATPPKPEVTEPKPAPPAVQSKPAPPPIPLKYFGYEGAPRAGNKLRALFVDGEENFIVGENDLIRKRYRIVRIGTTSAEIEDTVAKNTQTLRIVDRSDP